MYGCSGQLRGPYLLRDKNCIAITRERSGRFKLFSTRALREAGRGTFPLYYLFFAVPKVETQPWLRCSTISSPNWYPMLSACLQLVCAERPSRCLIFCIDLCGRLTLFTISTEVACGAIATLRVHSLSFLCWQAMMAFEVDQSGRRVPTLPLLHLPLENSVLPHLGAIDLGRLACVSKELRDLINRAEKDLWFQAAVKTLGCRHPVLSGGSPTKAAVRSALQRYSQACGRLLNGQVHKRREGQKSPLAFLLMKRTFVIQLIPLFAA